MKFRNKLLLKILSLILILFIFLGYKILFSINNSPKEWKLPSSDKTSIKFISEENLITDIKNANKLIPMELEISHTITVDDSWGDFDVFKKYKRITYTAWCSYCIDLSKLSDNDIALNYSDKSVAIKIPMPTVYSININDDKTVYEETFTGLLRFGDLNLTSEEYGVIEKEIKNSIANNMKEDELYEKACYNSKNSVSNLLMQILGPDITVNVDFINN